MRNTILMATSALALLAMQATGPAAVAQASAVQRYEGGATVQHMNAPQRTQALAQAEGGGGSRSETSYGRRLAQAEGGGGRSETMYGRRFATAEQAGVDAGSYKQASGEQTGVDNGRPA